jgi:LacI family transcriptional regulator
MGSVKNAVTPVDKPLSGIREVAARSGVGIATASAVLNNSKSTIRVSQATRERVLATAKDLRYRPNVVAQLLRGQATKTIGVLFGLERTSIDVGNEYVFAVLRGIIAALADVNYNVMLYTEAWHNAETSASPLRDRRTDGVVLIAAPTDADVLPSLADLGFPVVVISSTCDKYGVPSVDVDNVLGVRLATQHLIHLGHTRIAHIKGEPILESTERRYQAFRETLSDAGLCERVEYAQHRLFERIPDEEKLATLMSLPEPPTAIFTWDDSIAVRMMTAARQRGIEIPNQLSIIGFGDLKLGEFAIPPLTTVHEPLVEIGAMAVSLLVDILQGKDIPAQTYLHKPELVVRSSTAPPPA